MRLFSSVAVLLLCAACASDHVTAPSSHAVVASAARSVGTDSRVQWYFNRTLSDGVTAAKLYGDGRSLNGIPVPNPLDPSAYDGESQCGVRGTIEWYANPSRATGSSFIAPAGGSSSLCQSLERKLSADLGSTVAVGKWTAWIDQVMQLTVGESRVQDVLFGPNIVIPDCARLVFSESVVGSGVKVTRLSGDANRNAGVWTIESQGTHLAGCYNFGRGNQLTHTGPDYYLPFSARLVEVLR